jgi:hypothetical protein
MTMDDWKKHGTIEGTIRILDIWLPKKDTPYENPERNQIIIGYEYPLDMIGFSEIIGTMDTHGYPLEHRLFPFQKTTSQLDQVPPSSRGRQGREGVRQFGWAPPDENSEDHGKPPW